MPVTRKHTTRATSLNLADLPAQSGCFGRITRHSERAAADRPERDQERETRQGLENHMSEKSPTVPGAGQQRPRRPLDGTGNTAKRRDEHGTRHPGGRFLRVADPLATLATPATVGERGRSDKVANDRAERRASLRPADGKPALVSTRSFSSDLRNPLFRELFHAVNDELGLILHRTAQRTNHLIGCPRLLGKLRQDR